MPVTIKRAYEPPHRRDGSRYLVDRLWPRGVSKEEAALTGWLKDLAPSDDLRKWYGHDPDRWGEFKRRYKLELRAEAKQETIRSLAREADQGTVTLVYAAKDRERNNAAALKEAIEKERSSG
jgi:uncharacterized protein YeaO (DUF488 family)